MALVSIIIPLHDKGAYVADTIRSVQRQTVADWEVIVVENGSRDDGPEKVRSFDDLRVRLEISPKVGPGASRNHGLSLACGRWILFLDADDLLGPGYLSSRLALLESNPSSDLLVGRWTEFTDTSAGNGTVRLPEGEAFGEAWLRDASIAFAPWAVHAALIRREALSENPWPEHLDPFASEDTAFWFPLLQSHSVAFTLDGSAFYRILDGNSRNHPKAAFWTDSVQMVTSCNVGFLRQSGHGPNARQALFLMKAFESCYQLAIQEGDQKTASKALGLARQWLSCCRTISRPVLLRKLLGIPFHHRLMGRMSRLMNPARTP
jgi:hypothetical protein